MLNKEKLINKIESYNKKLDDILEKLETYKNKKDVISITKIKYYIDRYDYIIFLLKIYNNILLNYEKMKFNKDDNNEDIDKKDINKKDINKKDIDKKDIDKKDIDKKIKYYEIELKNTITLLDEYIVKYNNNIDKDINKIHIKRLIDKSEYIIFLIDILKKKLL